jgi:ectoine hydroxylase-related dioxygenase (phytanoyl-CoA dioxygenase family)
LRIIKGSHNWGKEVMPIKWLSGDNFYEDNSKYAPIPDPDKDPEKYPTLEWEMKPGDAIAFHFNAVHGARGNPTNSKRRVLSLRFIGDDAKYIQRDGKTSPPFPNHNMTDGQKLREDWFPHI